jgi:hypothetical protein
MKVPVVALFHNGGAPQAYPVKDVTADGAYLVTPERWYPGTIVSLVLQYDPCYTQVAETNGRPEAIVRMRGRMLRSGPDGVGLSFVYLNELERQRLRDFLAGAQVRGQK